MKFYISPSNQPANSYVTGNTNEKAQMEKVARQVVTLLGDYNCTAVLATLNLTIKKAERPKEAKDKGADFYLAIHSNSAGAKEPTSASGAVAFYHPDSAKAKELAGELVKELNAIAPVKSNRAESVINGMLAFDNAGYGEIRSPMEYGIPTVLAEINFHDNPVTAQWIIDNTKAIAQAIVNAMTQTFQLKLKNTSVPEKPDTSPKPTVTGEAFSADAKVTAQSLNVRKGPGVENEVLDIINNGLQVSISKKFSNGWYEISYGKKSGFVNGVYLGNITPKQEQSEDVLYRVQAGAYKDKDNAARQVELLKEKGVDSFIVPGKAEK